MLPPFSVKEFIMEQSYLIWSTKGGGWLANGITATTTVLADAKMFGRSEALRMARRQYRNGLSEYGLLPIAQDDLAAIARPE